MKHTMTRKAAITIAMTALGLSLSACWHHGRPGNPSDHHGHHDHHGG
jgi:hypothetical protein